MQDSHPFDTPAILAARRAGRKEAGTRVRSQVVTSSQRRTQEAAKTDGSRCVVGQAGRK